MSNVAVTGANGFLGTHLVDGLLEAGHHVSALSRNSTALQQERLDRFGNTYSEKTFDLTDSSELNRLLKNVCPKVIFHAGSTSLASEIIDEVSVNREFQTFREIMDQCLDHGIDTFVHFGSSLVYSTSNTPSFEDNELQPDGYYAEFKARCSNYAKLQNSNGETKSIELRLFNMYGTNDKAERLIPSIIQCAKRGEPIVLKNAQYVRDFVFVDDLKKIAKAICESKLPLDVYNVCRGVPVTIRDVADIVITLIPERGSTIHGSSGKANSIFGNNDRLTAAGLAPSTDLLDGLKLTIDTELSVR